MKKLFKNIWFHRSVYLLLLLLWTWCFVPRIDCLSCTSSFGIPYWLLYASIAFLLLLQVIFDKWITWFLFSILSIALSWNVIFDNYAWHVGRSELKGGRYSNFEIASSLFTVLIPCLLFLILLYAIRPVYGKHADGQQRDKPVHLV